jgi:hypothetical protein
MGRLQGMEKEMKTFRDFESAREFVRSLGLTNLKEWREFVKSGNKPEDIPSDPSSFFKNKGWVNNGDFLGTGYMRIKKYRKFSDTKKFVRALKLKNRTDYLKYTKSDNCPNDFSTAPQRIYKKEWKGWGDFLGTGNVAPKNMLFCSFEKARAHVQKLKLKTEEEWNEYCKSGNKPDDIPIQPKGVYKNKGWNGFGDFLGTGNVAKQNRVYRSFKEAREFIQSLGLKNGNEWNKYCKSGNKPDDIPNVPDQVYKNEGWKNRGDWLGTTALSPQDMHDKFLPFNDARKFAQKLGLKTGKEWTEYYQSGMRPENIPSDPARVYKKEYKGMGDWLGTGNVANQDKQYRPFKEAREFIRKLGLKGQKEWQEYCVSGNKPEDIPSHPERVYKKEMKKK